MKEVIMKELEAYHSKQGVAFLSREDAVYYFRGLVELIEGFIPTCHCENIDFGSYANTVGMVCPWNKKVVTIDTCIATEIGYLWHQGIITLNSCCGHGKLPPTVVVLEESIEKMQDLGYKHYKGKVAYPHQTFML